MSGAPGRRAAARRTLLAIVTFGAVYGVPLAAVAWPAPQTARPVAAGEARAGGRLTAVGNQETRTPQLPGPEAEVRPVRVEVAPSIDGRLDEPLWDEIEPVTELFQIEPDVGEAITERTEVRIAYDEWSRRSQAPIWSRL